MLKSKSMSLSDSEKDWLPWGGKTGKLAMGWACHLNQDRYEAMERVFESISTTRVNLLVTWANQQWYFLEAVADNLSVYYPEVSTEYLQHKKELAPDFSELFVVDLQGKVISSTYPNAKHKTNYIHAKALEIAKTKPILHGPYCDQNTLSIGASTSKFHDEVTLMFCQPIIFRNNQTNTSELLAILCGRVPNDVLGDLIQREAGHIFHESGDNYLFMVKSNFDPDIKQGMALSRSRFEDNSFSLGENLKQGVHTDYGVVKIQNHTEFEVIFNDPATNQLHPGIRETIRKNENLFVTYPGYSDYRHIPVIGKGVTFQMPHSPDIWGMMCEADLEEVYRYRSINWVLLKTYMAIVLITWFLTVLSVRLFDIRQFGSEILSLLLSLTGAWAFYKFGTSKFAIRIQDMTRIIRQLAEGDGNLTQRLDRDRQVPDETGAMARWINNFVDNLDNIIGHVMGASYEMKQTNAEMIERTCKTRDKVQDVVDFMNDMLKAINRQMQEINGASQLANQMSNTMQEVLDSAKEQFNVVKGRSQDIRQTITQSSENILALSKSTEEIGNVVNVISEIADQTNMLALNAAIEAARAGESGKGFAVVADEVRLLAERTTTSTSEIREIIENVQNQARYAVTMMQTGMAKMEEGLKLAEGSNSDNSELYEIVQKMFDTIQQIAKSSESHSTKLRQIEEISSEMQQALDGLNVSATQTQYTASRLHQLVSRFEISKNFDK